MEIRNYQAAGVLKLHLIGRLDAASSPQLAAQLDEAVHKSHQHIRLYLSNLDYVSSAGIQVLVRYRQQLTRTHGTFEISAVSDSVRKVLTLSGLDTLLASHAPDALRASISDISGVTFDIIHSAPDATLRCQVVHSGRGSDRSFSCWNNSLLVGSGALAAGTAWEHFGPVFAVGGAALCLPAGAQNTPDYLLAAAAFTPEVTLRNGIVCEGTLPVRAVFGDELSIGGLADAALEILRSDMGAVTVLGNTAAGEPVIAAGVAIRTPSKLLADLTEPLTSAKLPRGSFVAAICSGGPVAAFESDAPTAVAAFFQGRFEPRVPQRILSGTEAAGVRFAEGCLFAGVIASITGESER